MNTIIDNLRAAHEIVSAAAPETVYLQLYGVQTHCGTLHCSLGWIAASGRFSEHMRLEWDNHAKTEPTAVILGKNDFAVSCMTLNTLFGPDAFNALFTGRGAGACDESWPLLDEGPDRDLALWRIEQQIKFVEALQVPEVRDFLQAPDNPRSHPDDWINQISLSTRSIEKGWIHRTISRRTAAKETGELELLFDRAASALQPLGNVLYVVDHQKHHTDLNIFIRMPA